MRETWVSGWAVLQVCSGRLKVGQNTGFWLVRVGLPLAGSDESVSSFIRIEFAGVRRMGFGASMYSFFFLLRVTLTV